MKKVILFSTCIAAAATMAACGGPGAKGKAAADTAAAETKAVPEYTVINNATIDLSGFPQDKDGYYVIFDGKTFNGWRGYGKDHVPSKWTIDNGAIKFNGSGGGEAQDGDGGDLIFTHKFKNFELEVEWKVAKGSNSGIFYLGQEVATTKDGKVYFAIDKEYLTYIGQAELEMNLPQIIDALLAQYPGLGIEATDDYYAIPLKYAVKDGVTTLKVDKEMMMPYMPLITSLVDAFLPDGDIEVSLDPESDPMKIPAKALV